MSFKVSFRKDRPRKDSARKAVARRTEPPIKKRAPALAPPLNQSGKPATRLARLLALAHYIERAVESGMIKDYAEAARALGMTRARMGQVTGLALLSPKIQGMVVRGILSSSDRLLRRTSCRPLWPRQEKEMQRLLNRRLN